MYKIEILKSDGSLYWKEQFNKQSEAEKWIAEEQTRPYYNQSFTYSITRVGKTDEQLAQAAASEETKKNKRNQYIKSGAKKIKQVCNLTKDEMDALFGDLGD